MKDLSSLLALPNVRGYGRGRKKVKGQDTGQPCLTIFVERKVPMAALAEGEAIPPALEDGTPTDVVEVGRLSALVLTPPSPVKALAVEDHRQLLRPLVGGISCGKDRLLLAGTIGLSLLWKGDTRCLLSNNHVIALSYVKDPAGQPIATGGLARAGVSLCL